MHRKDTWGQTGFAGLLGSESLELLDRNERHTADGSEACSLCNQAEWPSDVVKLDDLPGSLEANREDSNPAA